MGKEISLADLSKGAVKQSINVKPAEGIKKETVPVAQQENSANTPSKDPMKTARKVSVDELAKKLPKKEEETVTAPIIQNAFDSLTNTMSERKERIENAMPKIMENAREIAMENAMKEQGMTDEQIEAAKEEERNTEYEDIPEVNLGGSTVKDDTDANIVDNTVNAKKNNYNSDDEITNAAKINLDNIKDEEESSLDSDMNDIDNLLKELESEDEDINVNDADESNEEQIERFKESLNSIQVTKDPIDITKFKIRQTPISCNTVLESINHSSTKKCADWVLYGTGRSFRISECSGTELEALRKTIDNSNGINGVIASLKLVYNHIIDDNKPDFEAWTKLIKTEDLDSLYAGLYKACYNDMNLVGRTCSSKASGGCEKSSLVDTDFASMVKFEDDNVKDRFDKLFMKDTTTDTVNTKAESEIIIVSDDIAIAYSLPTLYTTFIQYATLSREVTNKYQDLLNSLAYITGFFKIDKQNQELIPISVKTYPNNISKTVLSKLKIYSQILSTLTNDQYNILTAKLNNLIPTPKVTYIYPETECPECGKKMPEEEIESMLTLLFTRAQLARIKSL